MIFNNSKNTPYYTQRNNKKRPSAACNVTAATQACMITENNFPHPQGMQSEDFLMELLESKEAWSLLNTVLPGAICNPWNVSHCIAWAVNKACYKRICKVEIITLQEMIHHILCGGSISVSGKFTKSGHFVCLVGLETDQEDIYTIKSHHDVDLSKIRNIIVDDPWGDYTKNYKETNGNDVVIPIDVFVDLIFGKDKVKTAQMYYRSEVA
ncbi:MAG: hypothetical protein FWH53_00290 [Leptospirales bacterium]|nr:hypothetical protein [Leptospirales bacterium]